MIYCDMSLNYWHENKQMPPLHLQCIMSLNWMQPKKSKVLKIKLQPWNKRLKCYVLQEFDIKINITWDYTSLLDKYHLYAQTSMRVKCPKVCFQKKKVRSLIKKSEIINKKKSQVSSSGSVNIYKVVFASGPRGGICWHQFWHTQKCVNIYTILNKMV